MIIVILLLDVIIPGVIPKWAIFAPIFIPLFIQLGIPPQTGLAAYRVGDSPLNVVTPLMVYLPFMVTIAQRYQKESGIGTIIALMLPYVVIIAAAWIVLFILWFVIGRRWDRDTRSSSDPWPVPASIRAWVVMPMSDIAITFAILLVVVVAFVSNRVPVGLVAIGGVARPLLHRRPGLTQSLAGFGDPAVIFIATLFVVSEGLDATGVTTWAGQELIARVGDSRTRLLVLMMLWSPGSRPSSASTAPWRPCCRSWWSSPSAWAARRRNC